MSSDTADVVARVGEILRAHDGMEGPLLPILHAVQAEYGHVPQAALPVIAGDLNVSRAEVHGVVSFYHDFRDAPAGRHTLKLCRAEACQAMGADRVAAHAKAALGVDWHDTTGDGRGDAGAGVLPWALCLRACRAGGRAGGGPRGRGAGRCPDRRGDAMKIYVPRDAAAKALGGEAVAAAVAAEAARRGRRRDAGAQRVARDGLARAAGRGGDVDRTLCVRAGLTPRMCQDCSARLRRSSAGAGADGRPAVDEGPDAADLRAGGRDRPAVAGGLSKRMAALPGLRRALGDGIGRDRGRSDRLRACAAGAARAFRPGSSGRPWPRRQAPQKYIVCNADEGDSGTFADRMLMEGDPFTLIEGMAIAGHRRAARRSGYVYIRSEYPDGDRGDGGRRAHRPRGRASGASVLGSGHCSTWRSASAPGPMSAARKHRF